MTARLILRAPSMSDVDRWALASNLRVQIATVAVPLPSTPCFIEHTSVIDAALSPEALSAIVEPLLIGHPEVEYEVHG